MMPEKISEAPPLVLVDGSSYLYRAFHSLPPLSTANGEPTGAIYGVLSMLRKLRNDYQPRQMAVIFDAKGPNFRHELYPEYKATRPAMPEDLQVQIEPLHNIIQAMGFPLLCVPGVEADDVIGTLAANAHNRGQRVVISTGDKDMAQLVNSDITLVNTMTGNVLNPETVVEKFGVAPEQIIDYLTLVGDSVDNVPGVDKVGPKTAVKWLQEYGSLDGVLQNADAIKGKVGENLKAAREHLPLSKKLVTIDCDVSLDFSPEDLEIKAADRNELHKWFRRFEFKTWLAELEDGPGSSDPAVEPEPTDADRHYETVLTKAQFDRWVERLEQAELFAFDTETTNLDYMQAEIVGISFAVQPGEAAYVPLGH
ncbi:MAG TPA: 5'-3' exonuclease H3TH domain-containing protein, partial [Gammaproteobacteria bacterium]